MVSSEQQLKSLDAHSLAVAPEKSITYKHIIMLIIAATLLVLGVSVNMFSLDIGGTVFNTTLVGLLQSGITVNGQFVAYPMIAQIAGIASLVLAVATVVFAFLKKVTAATITSVGGAIFYLVCGITANEVVQPALNAAGLEFSVNSTYYVLNWSFYVSVILFVLLAISAYWLNGGEDLAKRLFLICACISIASVLLITLYMLIIGLPAIGEIGVFKFLFGTEWAPTHNTNPQFGILPMVLTSIACTLLSVAIGVPVGILTAVFLAELAPKWLVNIVHPAVELLAGIPSVIYGFFAMQILSPTVKDVFNLPSGDTMLTATLVLSIMILPTIITTAETGLKAVPVSYREASLAMGASKIRTIFKVTLPAARSAVLSGVILGVGRSIGETMAIIMVAGNSPNMPQLLGSVRPMTVGIVMEMSYAQGLHRDSLFSIGLVLFVFIMAVNLLFNWISKKGVQIDGKD